MYQQDVLSGELRVFLNHIYEFQKGIRSLILYTMKSEDLDFATKRLANNDIEYFVQYVDSKKVNLFFGRSECISVVKRFLNQSLNTLTPEEDFILGAMLGYDICAQCNCLCKP